jgi:hypothetical protein
VPTEEIIVLACSKKWGGRCVAGVSRSSGEWIRPVSTLAHKELTPLQYRIGGRDIQPLDVVHFEHSGPTDDPSQPENVEVERSPWRLTSQVTLADAYDELSSVLIPGPELLGNRGAAVIEEEALEGVESSLALIEPTATEFVLEPPWEGTSRPRPRTVFDFAGRRYDLALTDFLVRPRLLQKGYGSHGLSDLGFDSDLRVLLAVSLAEARDGWCTKLVAGVLLLPED